LGIRIPDRKLKKKKESGDKAMKTRGIKTIKACDGLKYMWGVLFVLTLVISTVYMCAGRVKAEDDVAVTYCSDDGLWTYTLDAAGGATIVTGATGVLQSGVLDIPSSIDSHKVVGIGDKAFHKDNFANYKNIETLNIPDSVISIGANAFNSCIYLTNIDIPENLTTFGEGAFWGTLWLDNKRTERADKLVIINGVLVDGIKASGSISIPSSVNKVAAWAFYESSVTGVTFANPDTELAECAFYHATKLTSLTLPENITDISDKSVSYCTALTAITIPASVERIGIRAFEGCSKLAGVTFAETKVEIIDDYAFSTCSALKTVTFSDNIKTIGKSAFAACTSLVSVELPEKLEVLNDYAFFNCTALETVSIPDALSRFGACTFYGTKWISNKRQERDDHLVIVNNVLIDGIEATGDIEIPDGVKTIASGAFYGRSTTSGATGAAITGITTPASLTAINGSAFYQCSSLENVELADSITFIGATAFSGCDLIEEITLPEALTTLGTSALPDSAGLKVYIPEQIQDVSDISLSEYKSLVIVMPENYTAIYNIVNVVNVVCYVQSESGELTEVKKDDVTESTTEDTTELTTESTTEPTTGPTTEQTTEPTTEPTTESITESTTEATTESTTEATTEPTTGDTTEPTTEKDTDNQTNNSAGNATDTPTDTPNNNPIDNPTNNTNSGNSSSSGSNNTKTKKTSISSAKVTLKYTKCTYDGKLKKPAVTSVKLGTKILKSGTDYKVTAYKNNKNIGTASVVITGIGSYKGTVTKKFYITIKKGMTFKYKSCKYKITSATTVSFTGVASRTIKNLTVPKTVKFGGKTFKVTTIEKGALKGNKVIKKLTIGAYVKTIGTRAFYGCTSLENVLIGGGLVTVGKEAFAKDKSMKVLKIESKKLSKLGKNCFKFNSKNSAKIKVPKSLQTKYTKLIKVANPGTKSKK
jgi:hypothetical protein